MKLRFFILTMLALLCGGARAQYTRWDYTATTAQGSGNLLPLLAIPYAGVRFYSCTGAASTTCTVPLTTYTAINGAACATTTAQVVLQGTSTCSAAADSQGNFGGWFASSGAYGYAYTLTVSSAVYGPFQFTVGSSSSSTVANTYNVANYPSSCTVNSVAYTTQADCAFYTALYTSNTSGTGAKIILPPGAWTTCAGWYWNTTSAYGAKLTIEGAGPGTTNLNLSCANSTAALYTTLAQNNMEIENLTVNAESLAPAAISLTTPVNLIMEHVYGRGASTGASAEIALLSAGYQDFLSDVQTIGYQPNSTAVNVTATVTSGALSGFTIINGGANLSATIVPRFIYVGSQAGASTQPCSTMPTNQPTYTITAGVLTAIGLLDGTTASTGAGCVGPVYVYVYDGDNVQNGMVLNVSDSRFTNLLTDVGYTCGINVQESNNVFVGAHPYDIPTGFCETGNTANVYMATEADSLYTGFLLSQTATSTARGSLITGTHWYQDTKAPYAGVVGYRITTTNSKNTIRDGTCGDNFSTTGYYQFMGPTGPATEGNVFSYPSGVGMYNEQDCATLNKVTQASSTTGWIYGTTMSGSHLSDTEVQAWLGQYQDLTWYASTSSGGGTPLFKGIGSRTTNGIFEIAIDANTAATSSNNYNSPLYAWRGYCWNGSTSVADAWTSQAMMPSGTNPTSTLTLSHSGCGTGVFGPGLTTVPVLYETGLQFPASNYTVVATTDRTIECQGSGITITLPATPVTGESVTVKNITTGQPCTISGNGILIDVLYSSIVLPALQVESAVTLLYDGFHWEITGSHNFTQPSLFVAYGTSTLTNTTTTTSLVPGGYGTMTQVPNQWVAGRVLRLTMGGQVNTQTSPGNFVINVNYGGSTITTATITNLASNNYNQRIDIELTITCRSITSGNCSAVIDGGATYSTGSGTLGRVDLSNGGSSFTFSTSTSNLLDVTGAWATASTSNIMRITTAVLQQVN